jgi:hypothetical protein
VRLARAALQGALAVPGVDRGDPGRSGLHVTMAGDRGRLPGVSCTAAVGGGYAVSLQLVCAAVPLGPLAERVRRAVRSAAVKAKVADELASISIRFSDLAVGESA